MNSYQAAIFKQELSAEMMDSVSLEFQLGAIDEGMGYLRIGFVDSDAAGKVRMDCGLGNSDRPTECIFFIRPGNQVWSKYEKGEEIKFDSKWRGEHCQNGMKSSFLPSGLPLYILFLLWTGDRILLQFDFVKSFCTVHYNDEEVGVLSEKLPPAVFVATSPYSPALTLELIRFEVQPKTVNRTLHNID